MNYFYGIITLIFTLMTISASPHPKPEPYVAEEIQEQKEEINQQKDCIKKIQARQEQIADELSKIKEMLKKPKN